MQASNLESPNSPANRLQEDKASRQKLEDLHRNRNPIQPVRLQFSETQTSQSKSTKEMGRQEQG